MFLDSGTQLDFDQREMVAIFRKRIGTDLDDPRVVQLVGELSLASSRFRQVWARHDVQRTRGGTLRIEHPRVGSMELNLSKLAVDEADDQTLIVYHPARSHPDSAHRLALLASRSEGWTEAD